MRSSTTPSRLTEATSTTLGPSDNERLQQRVDELSQQLLQARDAVLGAEAELGVARAHVAELSQQLHVRDVEIAELRDSIDQAGRRTRAVDASLAAGDRLARRAVRLARSRA